MSKFEKFVSRILDLLKDHNFFPKKIEKDIIEVHVFESYSEKKKLVGKFTFKENKIQTSYGDDYDEISARENPSFLALEQEFKILCSETSKNFELPDANWGGGNKKKGRM